ncbi:hypothetical protein [Deinococcus yavapaiensis]|uniref:hypothetical protein n=1 Tax=Deinococcus yavapaiensis TaxID=309889 RepID=UPI001B87E41B|nr:hypothetical protein [Deinococcus yavapaiensis]
MLGDRTGREVDDFGRAEPDEAGGIAGFAGRNDRHASRSEQLHDEGTHAARRAVDENGLTGLRTT